VVVHVLATFPNRSFQYVVHADDVPLTASHFDDDDLSSKTAGATYTVAFPIEVPLYVAERVVAPDTVGTTVNLKRPTPRREEFVK
jgi:hypothetical protein